MQLAQIASSTMYGSKSSAYNINKAACWSPVWCWLCSHSVSRFQAVSVRLFSQVIKDDFHSCRGPNHVRV